MTQMPITGALSSPANPQVTAVWVQVGRNSRKPRADARKQIRIIQRNHLVAITIAQVGQTS
jgi:hypothetical protein